MRFSKELATKLWAPLSNQSRTEAEKCSCVSMRGMSQEPPPSTIDDPLAMWQGSIDFEVPELPSREPVLSTHIDRKGKSREMYAGRTTMGIGGGGGITT